MRTRFFAATSAIRVHVWALCLCLGALAWVGCGPSEPVDGKIEDSVPVDEPAASGTCQGDCGGDACYAGTLCDPSKGTFSFWGVTAYANFDWCTARTPYVVGPSNKALIDCREFVERFLDTAFGNYRPASNISNICAAYEPDSVTDYMVYLPTANYRPVPGDAVIFTASKGAGHGVIVRGVDANTIYTIEQNRSCTDTTDKLQAHLTFDKNGKPYMDSSHKFQCIIHHIGNNGCRPANGTCTSASDCCAGQGLYCMAGHCRTYY
jgi:plastocyanin